MNAKKLACAPKDIDIHELWSKIDWNKCECFVQKLQARIVKAQREGKHNKVKALQWMLTHSFYAKALYNPQIEMFARFKMKSSFHKTKRII